MRRTKLNISPYDDVSTSILRILPFSTIIVGDSVIPTTRFLCSPVCTEAMVVSLFTVRTVTHVWNDHNVTLDDGYIWPIFALRKV